MLRTFTAGLICLLATQIAQASPTVQAQACYEATLEPESLKISDRIIGYCTTSIAAETDPVRKANLLTDRAILHIKRNGLAAARADLDESLRLHARSAAARITLAYLFWREGNLEGAEAALTTAISHGAPLEALINRSIVRRARGDIAGSMRDALAVAGYDADEIERLTPDTSVATADVNEGAPPAVLSPGPALPGEPVSTDTMADDLENTSAEDPLPVDADATGDDEELLDRD